MKVRAVFTSLIAAAAMLAALPASALLITTDGDWISVDGNPTMGPLFVDSDGNGTNDQVQFGAPFGDVNPGNSAYEFIGTTIDAPLDGTLFPIGDFVHQNFTIQLPSINGATLLISLVGPEQEDSTNLIFTHFETPNGATPCAAGGVNPCPDEVSLPGTAQLRDLALDGSNFTLEILGFSQDGGVTVLPSFLTLEGNENIATLYARITPVPETGTLALFGLGLIGLIAARRRNASRVRTA